MNLENHNVPREKLDKLKEYVDFLLKWNQKINLISKKTVPYVWERHIFDCVRLKEHIDEKDVVLDVGSGAGLPGVVLSILGVKRVVLVEADERKAAFLSETKRKLGLGLEVCNQRIETMRVDVDVIAARAFADLGTILRLTEGVGCNKYLLLKGQKAPEEIEEAKKQWDFEHKLHESSKDSYILEVIRKGDGY